MSHVTLRRAFVFLWATTGLVILWLSLRTALPEVLAANRPVNAHNLVFASVEAIAALLFLAPATLRFGGALLLTVLASALAMHAFQGEFAAPLVLYGAAVFFVTLHGWPAHERAPTSDTPLAP